MGPLSGWAQGVLAVLAVGVPVLLWRLDRRNRRLNYTLLYKRAVVAAPRAPGINIFYAGMPVDHPWMTVLRIANAGATAITAEDYEEPITVKVDGAKVLSAAVTLTRPESFNPDIEKKTDGAVVIGKRLMNPRDMWELQLLTDGKPDVSLSCRIVGIHDAKLLKVPTDSWGRPYRSTALDWAIGVVSSVALIVLGLTELGISDNVGSRLIAAFFFAVAAGWLPAILIRNTRRSRLFLP